MLVVKTGLTHPPSSPKVVAFGASSLLQGMGQRYKGVNQYILEDKCTVTYECFGQALETVRSCGAGCWLAKPDLDRAFRRLPMH